MGRELDIPFLKVFYVFMCYLSLAVPGLRRRTGFSLGAEGGSSLAAVPGLLTAAASLAAECGLRGVQTSGAAA